jgi:DNA-binding NtrC family response regulator
MALVLIVEDDQEDLQSLADLVADAGCEVARAKSLSDAREQIASQRPQLILCKVDLPDNSGVELLRDVEDDPSIEMVLTTARPTVDSAIAAVRLGAFDYLVTPVTRGDLQRVISSAIGTQEPGRDQNFVGEALARPAKLGKMVTVSPAMRRVFRRIERVAPTDVSVLIAGESGTGKELVARSIHELSSRGDGPFLAINCGAISPSVIESELFGHEKGSFTGAARRHQGCFERANEGTLLLDEITEMPTELQVKLLRVLETGKVLRVGGTQPVKASPRVIAATNREPEQEVATGNLREDLFYRLKVFPIRVPPLRERAPEEIALLADHFLAALNLREGTQKTLGIEALEKLQAHTWPGNVRELENAINAAFVLADHEIGADCVMLELGAGPTAETGAEAPEVTVEVGTPIAEAEKELIEATLDHLEGDKPAAAKTLGISLKTLYNRLKGYRRN